MQAGAGKELASQLVLDETALLPTNSEDEDRQAFTRTAAAMSQCGLAPEMQEQLWKVRNKGRKAGWSRRDCVEGAKSSTVFDLSINSYNLPAPVFYLPDCGWAAASTSDRMGCVCCRRSRQISLQPVAPGCHCNSIGSGAHQGEKRERESVCACVREREREKEREGRIIEK